MLRGALINEMELRTDKEYIAGRKDGCDIRLQAEKGISREHFRLKYTDGRWIVEAISRFGDIFSLGQKAESFILEHGQSFQIPPYEFQFLDVAEAQQSGGDATNVTAVDENEKTVIGAVPQVPYVKVVNSQGDVREMLRLEVGEIWVAGRDPSCQIIIPDQRVSRRQFEIHKVNGSYTIIDLASVNGTFLNSSPISSTDPQTLKSGDLITVLDNTMYFELHDPNFQYKIEKIEVPPLSVEETNLIEDIDLGQSADNESASESEAAAAMAAGGGMLEIPQIHQEGVGPQIDPAGGPFTGIPSQDNFNQNQFYTFSPPPSAQPEPKGLKKLMQNKPLMIAAALIFLGAAYGLSEWLSEPEVQKAPVAAVNESDPFSKLKPAQQTEVKELYTLADQMVTQQKYDLALEKLAKIHALLPSGYKDSKALEMQADQSLKTIVQQQKDEEMLKAKEEATKKIGEISEKCKKLLSPKITVDQMRDCLTPMAAIDPMAPEYIHLISEAETIEKDRQLKDVQTKVKTDEIALFKDEFKKAEKVQEEGFAFKAIRLYKALLKSTLPDPNHLKDKAKKRIALIEQKIAEKSQKGITEADILFQEGKLKAGVMILRQTLVYDPDNVHIKEKIEAYSQELRRQVRQIYQESIIDESYGLVDSTETKQGAKEKWKKITDLDLDDGEYYKKAVIKLKRYGVF